jgi:tetratricopeptide (TPR) repeat protein
MQQFLPDEEVTPEPLDGSEGVRRSWGDILNLNFFVADGATGSLTFADKNGTTHNCQDTPVQIQLRQPVPHSGATGVELVVFDGQHRYEALRKLSSQLQGLAIPLCIVLSPNSTQAHHLAADHGSRPVPEVFRALFVDVNKNSVAVGGHFNTLLSDSSVGSIACRVFCESVLAQEDVTGLAVVEWNIPAKKDATQIKRPYSITSIGVIEQGLTKALSDEREHASLLRYVLDLDQVNDKLYPQGAEDDLPPITWNRFSPPQRRILESQIRGKLVKDGLLRLYFETGEYRRAVEAFREAVNEYKQVIADNKPGFQDYAAVLDEVLEYNPIPAHLKTLRAAVGTFERLVEGKLEARINPIVRYGIFQRAMIVAWLTLAGRLKSSPEFSLSSITTGYISSLNWALDREKTIFSERKRPYMIHSVFRPTGQIKPTDSARDALTSLILASLGNKAVATAFVQTALGKASPGHESILLEVGSKAAGRFASILRKQHLRDFARAYPSDFSIPSDEREALSSLEKRVDELQRKVREKTASVAEYKAARKQFEDELEAKVGKAVQLGLSDLKTALSYESVVIESGDIEDADSAEET